jgi:hypothetical protein
MMMGATPCKKCGKIRARAGDKLCSVCWLVRELKREHNRGEHDERENPSCIRCSRARLKKMPMPSMPAPGKTAPAGYSGPFSHKDCTHPHTASARAKCRASRLGS